MDQVRNDRGAALVAVLMTAIIFSIAAFAALTMALSGRQRSKQSSEQRLRAQYAAEAGLVWAMQRLWADPSYCGTPGPPSIGGVAVAVTVTSCGAGNDHTLQAKVTY